MYQLANGSMTTSVALVLEQQIVHNQIVNQEYEIYDYWMSKEA